MEHWAFSLVWTLPAVLRPCLWKGSLLCLLWLPAGPAEVGGKGRPLTKTLNCFQKAPWISVPEIWQMVSREGSGPDSLTTGLIQMEGPSEVGDLWKISSKLRSLRYVWGPHDLVLWGQHDPITHAESPNAWNLSSRVNERRVFKPMKKAMRHCYSKSVMIPVGPGWKLALPSFCLCRQFCLTGVPAIYLREKLFLKAFPGLQKHSSNYRH